MHQEIAARMNTLFEAIDAAADEGKQGDEGQNTKSQPD
jgi:hypothetical protein